MSLKISKSAVVCVEADIHGDVEIGERTVIHPKAQIIAENGPIIIGTDNLIEECVVIRNRFKTPMRIGNENIFEVSSSFEGFFYFEISEFKINVAEEILAKNQMLVIKSFEKIEILK